MGLVLCLDGKSSAFQVGESVLICVQGSCFWPWHADCAEDVGAVFGYALKGVYAN